MNHGFLCPYRRGKPFLFPRSVLSSVRSPGGPACASRICPFPEKVGEIGRAETLSVTAQPIRAVSLFSPPQERLSRGLGVRSARKTVRWTVFSGGRAAAQDRFPAESVPRVTAQPCTVQNISPPAAAFPSLSALHRSIYLSAGASVSLNDGTLPSPEGRGWGRGSNILFVLPLPACGEGAGGWG